MGLIYYCGSSGWNSWWINKCGGSWSMQTGMWMGTVTFRKVYAGKVEAVLCSPFSPVPRAVSENSQQKHSVTLSFHPLKISGGIWLLQLLHRFCPWSCKAQSPFDSLKILLRTVLCTQGSANQAPLVKRGSGRISIGKWWPWCSIPSTWYVQGPSLSQGHEKAMERLGTVE